MTTKQLEQIDSEYFSEEDVMDIQTKLIENGDIEPGEGSRTARLLDPLFLARALDRLIDNLIAEVIEYPEEMLFGSCDGSHRRDFERVIQYVNQEKAGNEEQHP